MAPRRRDRRPSAAANSDRVVRDPRSPASNGRSLSSYLIFIVFVLLVLGASIALYPSSHSSPILSVFDRELVKPRVDYKEIIRENAKVAENRTHRHFPNPVLAYVTPWNSKGYDMAKLFTSKFTHLSPVWYDLKSEGKNLVLDGRHNADMDWISELRRNAPSMVLPRVVLEAFPAGLLQSKKQRSKAIDIIVTECNC